MNQGVEFQIRTVLSSSQKNDLVRLYAGEWWTKERTASDVDRMLLSTDLIFAVVEVPSEVLVAFARVLTDRTYVAFVLDVIVAAEHRGNGLGALMMGRICSDPVLGGVASIELVCQPELVPFYSRWGFTDYVGRSRLMRRTSDPVLVGGGLKP
jgi:hypothetical protein